ncbi:hypothetical protein CRM22_004677 [Opisthorchis felineus]|uniref:Uncharacterized protein n=1 Tax=Opisthorchis felineus TaxID=147828 RepID=A0A4S2M1E5_OPIFE|nr:hypothetical protein CRM22_004677 [Opisthorchis felineus]TGZ67668.1 hypothetical protein CRM22_004677 [Opisthorchis felineus]
MKGPGRSLRVSIWTLSLMCLLTLGYALSHFVPTWFTRLALYPVDLFSAWRLSTVFTFWFATDEHITHWLTILTIFMLDKLIRDSWSKLEAITFLVFVNTLAVLSSAFILFLLDRSPSLVLSGNAAVIAATTVVSMQFDGERFLLSYGHIGLKSRHGFIVGFLLYLLFALFSFVRWTSCCLYFFGFLWSWFYLRFLQYHPQRRYGDHRSSFALAKFFPGACEHWIAFPSNLIYHVLLRSKLCPGVERQSEIVSTASFAAGIPGLTSDADRHRRIALKALNERLFTKPVSSEELTEWPDLNETDGTNTSNMTGEHRAEVQSVVVDLTVAPSTETAFTDTPPVLEQTDTRG